MELQLHNANEDNDLFHLMKAKMSTEQEQIFMLSHFLYLQHGSDCTKFVVEFDDVWKNVEFTRRDNAKRILIKNFTEHIDYKIFAYQLGEAINEQKIHGEKAAPHLGGAALSINKAAYQSGEGAHQLGGAPKEKNLGGAGQNKETILLTVDCFKNFCMIAGTPKSKVIRTYYVKMENIMHEYYKNFQSKNNELQNSLQHSQKETAIKRHEVLIESNKNKWLVYFCKIQSYDDGSFILKIGETADIKKRIDVLRCDFEMNIILLDVFICENSIKFEKSLHNNTEIVKYKYNHLEHKNKKISTEAYRIPNQKEYEKIVKIANNEMYKYNNIELTKLRIEEKKIDLDASKIALFASLVPLCINYDQIMNILNKITTPLRALQLENELIVDSEKEIITEDNKLLRLSPTELSRSPSTSSTARFKPVMICDAPEIEKYENKLTPSINDIATETGLVPEEENDKTLPTTITANSTGPIVQIYHKNDLKTVVHVYNSIMEATRDFNYNNKTASFTSIKKAYQYKTIYLDYRWHFICNRQELDLHKPRSIGETVITQERNQGQIAMLNIDKTKILKVFKLSKDAAKEILQHPSAMCVAIKHSSPLNNHYWMRWENVEDSLQHEFLQSNPLPIKQKNIRGIKIKQLHPITNEIVKIFVSYTDIQKELKISVKKIKELVENNDIYKGQYKFKLV